MTTRLWLPTLTLLALAAARGGGSTATRAGIAMKAHPKTGDRYFQEWYPGEAMDQGEVLATDASARVPYGRLTGLLETKDFTRLEPKGDEHKYYKRGVGVVLENSLYQKDVTRLVSMQQAEPAGRCQRAVRLIPCLRTAVSASLGSGIFTCHARCPLSRAQSRAATSRSTCSEPLIKSAASGSSIASAVATDHGRSVPLAVITSNQASQTSNTPVENATTTSI